jgi:tetratricopeptide (TPR) repeat protein
MIWSLSELGEFAEATERAEQASRIAEAGGNPGNIVAANWAIGYLQRAVGQVRAAREPLERAFALCKACGLILWFRPCAAVLGHTIALDGRPRDALNLLAEALTPAENHVALSFWMSHQAEAYLLVGRTAAAAEMAERAVRLAESRRELGFAAHALRVAGDVARAGGRLDLASAHFRRARDLADERAMRPLATLCRQRLDHHASK